MTDNSNFFDEQKDQSRIKAELVSKYFTAWSRVMLPSAMKRRGKIAYIDLFAGKGKYDDGNKTTPLLILEKAAKDKALQNNLITVFNDADPANCNSLRENIRTLPNIGALKNQPIVINKEVDDQIISEIARTGDAPKLSFVDPFGYKGVTQKLIKTLLQGFGCDCILFFNYLRINSALENEIFTQHMDALFGEVVRAELKNRLVGMDVQQRELEIIETFSNALQRIEGKYVLPFCFKNEIGTRTSHHLIFISKSFEGYDIMKQIMAKYSTSSEQGVPSFMYNAADARQPMLFELNLKLDELGPRLLTEFAGKSMSVDKLYKQHSVGKPYLRKNYKDVLMQLEKQDRVMCLPHMGKRRSGTMANEVKVTFKKL